MTTQAASDIFHEYLLLHPANFSGLIYLVQDNYDLINELDPHEAAEIRIAYFEALHEMQEYDRVVHEIDIAIEAVIRDNVITVNRVNAYEKFLFLKAISCLKIQDPSSIKLSRALVRMNPDNKKYNKLLQISCQNQESKFSKLVFALGIAACFLAIAFLLTQQFIVQPFYAAHSKLALQITASLFLLGPLLMLLSEIYPSIQAKRQANKIKNS